MHASDYVEEGTPVINVRNIGFGSVVPEKLEYIGEETVDRLKGHLLRTNDIVFGRKGAVERHALIRDQHDGWFQGSDCLRLRINSPELSPTFVSYSFLTDSHQKWMMNHCSHGATMASLNQAIVCRIPLRFPDMRTQNTISGILSAYDDLIKNNTRRIEILEEMALIIYREWFVNFRFPGHEKFRLVGSILGDIPEGWEIADLESVCVERNGIQTGPFGSQLHMTDYSDEGVPVVMPKDLIGFRIRTDEIARIPESIAEKLSRHRMQPSDIVYGRRGDIGRRAYLMPDQAGWFCGTGCLRIRPNSQAVNGWYLFNYLGQDDVQGIIRGRALGVTMPNLNTGVMASVPVKLPPRELQDVFARLTFPMAEAREVLSAAIENLRSTRDLLLPKLVSGEVSVQQMEIESAAQTV
jgi:type I restriction enzyme S subunit